MSDPLQLLALDSLPDYITCKYKPDLTDPQHKYEFDRWIKELMTQLYHQPHIQDLLRPSSSFSPMSGPPKKVILIDTLDPLLRSFLNKAPFKVNQD